MMRRLQLKHRDVMPSPVPPRFHGIYPMMYAFFGPDGTVDRDAMRRQVRACVQSGAHGIAVLGLATEAAKLSADERCLVVQLVIEEVAGKVPVAVTVAEPTVLGQVRFANWAAENASN